MAQNHQLIKVARPTKGQHISFVLFFNHIYLVHFSTQHPAKTVRPIITVHRRQNDAVSRKEIHFGNPYACKNFQGVHFPKSTKLDIQLDIQRKLKPD
jgi:hypothetical protein